MLERRLLRVETAPEPDWETIARLRETEFPDSALPKKAERRIRRIYSNLELELAAIDVEVPDFNPEMIIVTTGRRLNKGRTYPNRHINGEYNPSTHHILIDDDYLNAVPHELLHWISVRRVFKVVGGNKYQRDNIDGFAVRHQRISWLDEAVVAETEDRGGIIMNNRLMVPSYAYEEEDLPEGYSKKHYIKFGSNTRRVGHYHKCETYTRNVGPLLIALLERLTWYLTEDSAGSRRTLRKLERRILLPDQEDMGHEEVFRMLQRGVFSTETYRVSEILLEDAFGRDDGMRKFLWLSKRYDNHITENPRTVRSIDRYLRLKEFITNPAA